METLRNLTDFIVKDKNSGFLVAFVVFVLYYYTFFKST